MSLYERVSVGRYKFYDTSLPNSHNSVLHQAYKAIICTCSHLIRLQSLQSKLIEETLASVPVAMLIFISIYAD